MYATTRNTDIMVFMLSDLDITFDCEKPYVFAIVYGLSPENLRIETVRMMREIQETENV